MKLTESQKRKVKSFIKEMLKEDVERIPPRELTKRISRSVNEFKQELTKAGYEFTSKRGK